MKNVYLFLIMFLFAGQLYGQRFLESTFETEVTRNQFYGANFTAITIPVTGSSTLQPLVMDVYEPAGDTADERPLIIYVHTGNFLPIIVNGGISGTKSDSATVEICTRLAELGYVVASIDYRLGWNPFGATQPDRAFSLINAAYRGVQDVRTAVRYFRRDFTENNNQWGIDQERITVFGQGTGGYLSLTGAVLDEYLEIPQTMNPPGKFLTDLDGNPMTLEPMIIEAWNGDIFGTSLGIAPTGDTLCVPNHVGYSSDFDLSINLGGAMADISWMEAGDVPIISFHAPQDQFAPYYDDILRVGTNNDPVVQVQGSHYVAEMGNALGNNDVFDQVVTDEWTEAAMDASAKAGHQYYEALFPFNRPINVFGNFESAPWEWWNPSVFDTIPHPFVPGATIHQVQLTFNAMQSRAQAERYIDTIINYIAPRAFIALDLDNWSGVQEQITAQDVSLKIGPNPATDVVNFSSDIESPITRIVIFDATGKTVKQIDDLRVNDYQLQLNEFSAGNYYVGISFDRGLVVEPLTILRN